jgi:hypothetical protein
MNPEAQDLLAQLRDIHGAPAPGWWPPAPGWWILGLLALLGLAWLGRRAVAAARVRRRRRALLRRLDQIGERHDPKREPQAWLAEVNQLLKSVALRAFPRESCAPMEGERWVRFLQSQENAEPLAALARGPYEPRPRFEPGAVHDAARRWIHRHG